MGEQNEVTSLQTVCCASSGWYHRSCLKVQAFNAQDDFRCPNCGDEDTFRENMQLNGIYIPKSNTMAQYNSFNGDLDVEPPQKKRRIRKDWIYERTFKTKAEADKFLSEGNWGYHYDNKSEDGVNITYRCKSVKFRGVQCAAAVRLIFDSRSDDIQLFRADADHTHDNNPNAIEIIPLDVQEEMRRLFENNVTKPKAMKVNLAKKGFDLPSEAKFKTFMKKLNDERFGKEKIHCGTLEKWLQENSSVPDSDTKPFVLSYEMNYENESNIDFRFFVTSKLLLKQAIEAKKIHTDATYKMVWQGFPILRIGFTDLYRTFHDIGIAVCVSETTKDFEFIFASTVQGMKNIFDVSFEPEIVIADAAAAIHKAAHNVFGPNIKIIMCWFHMRRAVADKLPAYIKDIRKQQRFLADLDQLQVSKTIQIFNKAIQLFMEKWRLESTEFIDYFEKEWVMKNSNWFEAFEKCTPSTNNSLESRNRVEKDEHTLRERMDLGKFRVVLISMVEAWNISYTSGMKSINIDAPEITLNLWTKGYQFAKSNAKITSVRRGNQIVYRTGKDGIDDTTDFEDFDSFKSKSFSFYDTTFCYPAKRENWLQSECQCSDYFKLYICSHIIGIAIRLKCIAPPAEAKAVPIGEKRKRGRPAKAKPALVRQ